LLYHERMLFKIIAFIAALVPLILFVRTMFFRRPTRFGERFKEYKKQVDVAVWIFLGLVACVMTFAAGKLIWTWWTSL
jgi:NADH:ubiquinone oxidoreductase subunit 6 (subunit J)